MDARILLVEDDPSIREVTAIGLGAAGFVVTTAADGVEGIERFKADPFDLVLLDIMLPRIDGYEVCRQIRKTSTVPVVMLTARGDTMDVVVGLEAGADDYVRKPFDLPELIARIRAALRRAGRRPEETPELSSAPSSIDMAGRTASRAGQTISADPDRVRSPPRARPPRRPGPVPRRPPRSGLGLRLPRRLAPRRRRDPAPAGQDRGRSGQPRADPDGPRRRLQGRPLNAGRASSTGRGRTPA